MNPEGRFTFLVLRPGLKLAEERQFPAEES